MKSLDSRPRIVTLGTAGGPRWWDADIGHERAGISTAIVVGDSYYLVDCGQGVGRRIRQAGLTLANLRGIFITHLHSDHTVDLASLALFGLYELPSQMNEPIKIVGPGNRGMLPIHSPRAAAQTLVAPHLPTPGTREMFQQLMCAHATDLNDRIIDSLRPSPLDLFDASDIEIPVGTGYHPNDEPAPRMDAFTVYEDDLIKVSAILVEHPPIAPAFGFRFDTDEGSVAFSGDTTYTQNMVALAQGTDLLLHEAIDFDYVESLYRGTTDERSRASRDHHYKSHTSVPDAAKVAREADAKQLALHHLVPGTPDSSVWKEAGRHYEGTLHVPRDLDVISLRHPR